MQPLKRLSSRAFWGLASWAFPLVVVFLISPRLLHAIGASRFGVLMIALVTPLIAGQLEFGITSAAVRRLAARFVVGPVEAGTMLFTLLTALSIVGLAFGIGIWVAAVPISRWLGFAATIGEGSGQDLVRACAIWVAASLVMLTPAVVARAAQAMFLTAATQTVVTVVLWVGALYLVRQGAPLENVVWLGLVLGVASSVITLFAMRRLVVWGGPVRFVPRLLAEDARFSAGMFAAQAASALVYQGDRMLVSALGSPATAGLYVLCTSIASKTAAAVGALSSFVFPHAAGLQSAGQQSGMVGLVHALDRAVAALLIPVLLLALLLAEPFLKLWLGHFATAELTATFRILVIAFAFPAFAMPVSNVLVASGVSGLSARFAWLTVVVVLTSMIWLIPRFGLAGAACSMLLGNSTSLLFAWMARRSLRMPPAPDRRRFWLGILLGSATQSALLFWLGSGVTSWPGLLVTAAVAWSVFYILRAIVAALSPEEAQLLQRLSAAMRS